MDALYDTRSLFAVADHRDAARLTALGLEALKGRGGDHIALAGADGLRVRTLRIRSHGGDELARMAIGQLSTQDSHGRLPIARSLAGLCAVTLSGRLLNGKKLRAQLQARAAVFQSADDAEVLLHLLAHSTQDSLVNRIVDALWQLEGAYCGLIMSEDRMIAVRDAAGYRPLWIGRLGESTIFSTEDTAIRAVGGDVVREVRPGELVMVENRVSRSIAPLPKAKSRGCMQEYLSVADCGASMFGRAAHGVRVALGEALAVAHPCDGCDVVIGIPGAGKAVAAGYARAVAQPLDVGFVGDERASSWRPVPAAVAGKSVCLVGATWITGHSIREIVRRTYGHGATAVHVRLAAPLVAHACPFGLQSDADEVVGHVGREEEMAHWMGAETVAWLRLNEVKKIVRGIGSDSSVCDACWSGDLPAAPDDAEDQLPLF